MKKSIRIFIFALLVILMAIPTIAQADGPDGSGDKFVLGGTYRLDEGETLDGNLFIIGGTATVDEEAKVNGDILLTGGTLTLNGEVKGNIMAIGGLVSLGETAHVHGNIGRIGASVQQNPKARVDGEVIESVTGPYQFSIPWQPLEPITFLSNIISGSAWFLFRTLSLAALAMILILFILKPAERVADSIVTQPWTALGIGLLTVLVAPIVIVILAITIIMIPVALIGLLAFALAILFGWVALGLEIGKRIAQLFKVDWAPAVSAGVGTFLLTFITATIGYIPCIGWLAPTFVGIAGLGGVIITRFGTRDYPIEGIPPASAAPVPVVVHPAPPVPPSAPVITPVVNPAPVVTEPAISEAEEVDDQPAQETESQPPSESEAETSAPVKRKRTRKSDSAE